MASRDRLERLKIRMKNKSYICFKSIFVAMTQFNVKGRYTDNQGRSHNFQLISDVSDRRFIEDLVRAQFPAKTIFINTVNQDLR